MKTTIFSAVLLASIAVPALAQSASGETQRNVNQEQRIENGLKTGQLTTHEASQLERKEARVDRAEANAMRDGTMTDAEKTRIGNLQNQASRDIRADKHNAQVGDPTSASSRRMQADVQRDVNQQQRVNQGVRSGELTNREAGRLEHAESHVDRREARAGADGHVGAGEQRRIQRAENHSSRRIFRQKHDAQVRG
ncbi:MAG: hypothetical protein ACTHL1_01785 [Burkholderiaceae bacterium]